MTIEISLRRGYVSNSKVSEQTRLQLAAMFLPELHQSWWAERLAQLRDEKDATTDPAQVGAIEDRIREHYKLRHDVDLTRKRVGLPSQPGEPPRSARQMARRTL
jgi:hypothetical protein